MADGIKIKNDFGTILLDANDPVLVVVASGNVTLGNDGSAYIGNYPNGKVAVRGNQVVSTAYFNALDPYPAGTYIFGPSGANVTWYVFDQITGNGSNAGIKLRNGSGQLTYDVGSKPCRVIDIKSGSNWAGTVSLPGGRAWAFMPLNPPFSSAMTFTRQGTGDPRLFFQREDLILAGGVQNGNDMYINYTQQVRRQYGPYDGTALPTGYTYSVPRGTMAIIDVTGY